MARLLTFLFILFLSDPASQALGAVGLDTSADLLLFGDFRQINQSGVSTLQSSELGEFTGVGGVTLSLVEPSWRIRARPEFRFLQSPGVGVPSTDPAFQTVEAPSRFLPLQWQNRLSETSQLAASIELLDLSINSPNGEIYAGRRPVGLGFLRIFPVWNKFTKPLPVAPGAALVYSQDVAGARYQLNQSALQAFQILGNSASDDVSLGEFALFSQFIEIHVLGAWWWQQPVVGLALAKDILGLSLKSESLLIGSTGIGQAEFQSGAGAEYAFDERWSALLEAYLQSLGATDPSAYTAQTPSRFDPLRAFLYAAAQLTFKATQLLTLSAGTLVNCIDGSNYILTKGEYSLSDNSSVFVSGFFPVGERGEFTPDAINYPNGASVGAPMQISGGLRFSL